MKLLVEIVHELQLLAAIAFYGFIFVCLSFVFGGPITMIVGMFKSMLLFTITFVGYP